MGSGDWWWEPRSWLLGSRKVPCTQGEMSVGEAVPSPSPQRDLHRVWAQAWSDKGPGTPCEGLALCLPSQSSEKLGKLVTKRKS